MGRAVLSLGQLAIIKVSPKQRVSSGCSHIYDSTSTGRAIAMGAVAY